MVLYWLVTTFAAVGPAHTIDGDSTLNLKVDIFYLVHTAVNWIPKRLAPVNVMLNCNTYYLYT